MLLDYASSNYRVHYSAGEIGKLIEYLLLSSHHYLPSFMTLFLQFASSFVHQNLRSISLSKPSYLIYAKDDGRFLSSILL